jgi:hypothetical protein
VFTLLSPLTVLNYIGVLYGESMPILYQSLCTLVLLVSHACVFLFIHRHRGNYAYYIVQAFGLVFALLLIWLTPPTTESALVLLSIVIVSGALAQLADIARVTHSAWSFSRWRAWRFFLLWFFLALMSGLCWAAALYFFLALSVTDKSKAPWTSRDMNKECVIGFYDSHDVWHFLSALALYFQTLLAFHFQFPTGGRTNQRIMVFDTRGFLTKTSSQLLSRAEDEETDVAGMYLDS